VKIQFFLVDKKLIKKYFYTEKIKTVFIIIIIMENINGMIRTYYTPYESFINNIYI